MKNFWTIALLSVVGLNLTDALFTFHIIGNGVEELNPLMRYSLDNGIFLQVKVLASLILCFFYARIRSLPTKLAVAIVLVLYIAININHVIVLATLQGGVK